MFWQSPVVGLTSCTRTSVLVFLWAPLQSVSFKGNQSDVWLWHRRLSLRLLLIKRQHDRTHAVAQIHTFLHAVPANRSLLSDITQKKKKCLTQTAMVTTAIPSSRVQFFEGFFLKRKTSSGLCDSCCYCAWHSFEGPSCWRRYLSVQFVRNLGQLVFKLTPRFCYCPCITSVSIIAMLCSCFSSCCLRS